MEVFTFIHICVDSGKPVLEHHRPYSVLIYCLHINNNVIMMQLHLSNFCYSSMA